MKNTKAKMKIYMQGVVTMLALAIGIFGVVTSEAAGDSQAGARKAASCVACHGPQGKSVNPMWPSLAGQKQGYLVKQMTDFREGRRQDPLMSPTARPLSDVDIADLAAYFASL